MIYNVIISETAQMDMVAIYDYITYELLAPDAGKGQLERLKARILKLNDMPERYKRVPEEPWYSENVRMMPVDNYIVFYMSNTESATVEIMRVVYGGRNYGEQLEEYSEKDG